MENWFSGQFVNNSNSKTTRIVGRTISQDGTFCRVRAISERDQSSNFATSALQERLMNPRTVGLLFAIATAVFWGLYGPALGKSRMQGETPFKPYIFIGFAYLIWGCLGGAIAVLMSGDGFHFSSKAGWWGFIAGTLGAFGALTLTFAMFKAKDASLVMPVVFGGATAVAAITGLVLQAQAGTFHLDYRQVLGFLLVICGVVLIQKYSDHGAPASKPAAHAVDSHAGSPTDESPKS